MTSSGWCCKPKITAPVSGGCRQVCEARGYSVRCWVGVCHWDTETLTLNFKYQRDTSIWLIDGDTTPGLWSGLDQHNFAPNTSFCTLEVWHGLIRVVVLHLLSRGKNFHRNKHSRNCTQYRLISLRKVRTSWPQWTSSAYFANSWTCNLFLSGFLFLISKRNYSTARKYWCISTRRNLIRRHFVFLEFAAVGRKPQPQ